ncbi:Myosin type-2 heavy chain 1, partial [Spiromyces aspiralis]
TAARLFMARGKLRELRQANAAVTIQKHARGFLARRQYTSTVRSAILVQSAVRGWLARKQYRELRRERAAVKIQAVWRGFLARRWFAAKREAIIRAQSYLRTKKAKLEYIQLKAHAKSAAHFKEVTYKLEGKVVELTRQVEMSETECKSLRSKNRRLEDLCSQLESQLVAMKDEAKRSAESSKERIESLEQELDQLKIDHINLAKERDRLIDEIDLVKTESDAIQEKEKARADRIEHMLTGITEQLEMAKGERDEYKEKVVHLERLLEQQQNSGQLGYGGVVGQSSVGGGQNQFALPSAIARKASRRNLNNAADVSGYVFADSHATTPTTTEMNGQSMTPAASRGSGLPVRASGGVYSRNSRNGDQVDAGTQQQQQQPLYSTQTELRESVSSYMANGGRVSGGMQDIILRDEQEVYLMLENDDKLFAEILDEIIGETQVPPIDPRISYTPSELLFPAHLIGLCVIKMFQYNIAKRIDQLLMSVVSRVQKRTNTFQSNQEAAFWLSNVFELLSIIKTSMNDHQMTNEAYAESERVMNAGMQYLESLLSDIYFGWVKELQKNLSRLIIPAVVEYQELGDYRESESFLTKMIGGASKSSDIKLAHVLTFFSKTWEAMVFYYVDVAIMKQIMSDLLCTVGATAFNNLIARRNFCSSNRGMQIQYNVSKIEEWCKLHEVSDNTQNLDRLLQLAKVLQMHKETPEDLEIIREVSDLLTPAQIKQILKNYKPADSEAPIPSSLIHHPMLSSSSSTGYLLNTGDMADQVLFLTARKVPAIETFIPHYIVARRIRALIDSQTQVSYVEDDEYDQDEGDLDYNHGAAEYPAFQQQQANSGGSGGTPAPLETAAVQPMGLGLDAGTLADAYEYRR